MGMYAYNSIPVPVLETPTKLLVVTVTYLNSMYIESVLTTRVFSIKNLDYLVGHAVYTQVVKVLVYIKNGMHKP